MSWQSKLKSWLKRKPKSPPEPPQKQPPTPESTSQENRLEWFRQLAKDAAEGKRVEVIFSPHFQDQEEKALQDGVWEKSAEWMEKMLEQRLPEKTDFQLRAHLASRYVELGYDSLAIVHWEKLVHSPENERAHFELAEHHRRKGNVEKARKHYEAVLAINVRNESARYQVLQLTREPENVGDQTLAGPALTDMGAYALIRQIGKGATATVYLAKQKPTMRHVALKVLHPHLHHGPAANAFLQEATRVGSLSHPHIVRLFDIDPTAFLLTLEMAGGGTLRGRLTAKGPLSPHLAIEMYRQMMTALDSAHDAGLVHRDLKPENILFRVPVTKDRIDAMLGDFGAAHLQTHEQHDRALVGTLPYLSPEQRQGDVPTPAMDVFSMAVVFFEALTGTLPWNQKQFLSESTEELQERIKTGLSDIPHIQAHLSCSIGSPEKRPTTHECIQWAHAAGTALETNHS